MERKGFDGSVVLTKNERRLRTWWLWVMLLTPFATVFSALVHASDAPIEYQAMNTSATFAFYLVLCLPACIVIWYCAYKKYGTRWLTFLIWSAVLTYLLMIPMRQGLKELGFTPTFHIIDLFFLMNLYLNIRLRKINRKILQHFRETASEVNQRFLDSHDLETLKVAYKEEKKLWPLVSRYIRKSYKDRKMELSTGKKRVDMTVLTQKEMLIRKFWLYYLMFLPTALAVIWLITAVGVGFNPYSQQTFLAIGFITAVIMLQFLPTWILYHCAYKKHGTRYLTLNLCLSLLFPLSFLVNMDKIGKLNPFGLLVMILLWALWVYLCVKLRNINKLLQANRGCNCPEYHQQIALLNESVSLEDLDTAFYRIMEKWPQWGRHSSMNYKKRREELI